MYILSHSLINSLTDFAAALPEDVAEDQVADSPLLKIQCKEQRQILFYQEQEDFAASKLKSAVHAFLDKNGKVGVAGQKFDFTVLSSQKRYMLRFNS